MRKILFLCFVLINCSAAFSQSGYKQAIGLKFPAGLSITYKNFIKDNNAIEAQAHYWSNGIRFSGLYEFHFYNIEGAEGLGWFVGPGMHVGIWNDNFRSEKKFNTRMDLGIDGIIGLDYKFKDLPINISADWQPCIVIAGYTGFQSSTGGVAVRYTF